MPSLFHWAVWNTLQDRVKSNVLKFSYFLVLLWGQSGIFLEIPCNNISIQCLWSGMLEPCYLKSIYKTLWCRKLSKLLKDFGSYNLYQNSLKMLICVPFFQNCWCRTEIRKLLWTPWDSSAWGGCLLTGDRADSLPNIKQTFPPHYSFLQ